MPDNQFIVRSPLLNAAQHLLGYELSWYSADAGGGLASDEELIALIEFAASQLVREDSGWQLDDLVLFFEATPAVLVSSVLGRLTPARTVLRVNATDLQDAATLEHVRTLRQRGYGISLCNADELPASSTLPAVLTHAEGRFWQADGNAAIFRNAGVQLLARPVDDWATYDACAAAGMAAFIGNLQARPRPAMGKKGLNASQIIIVQLMDMVRNNSDVRQLEDVLKRDATLSYKLFRYINSASFGLGIEIQSLRHAVTMLGYSPLYRWLSLLLATAGDDPAGELLMQSAIVRGRIAELAGHGILPKGEAENLFVVGMFSQLDRLLGMPMSEVLDRVHLSDAVSQALLSREGMYGPFLSLAEACEHGNGPLEALADSLFVSARQVNESHLAALAWARRIRL